MADRSGGASGREEIEQNGALGVQVFTHIQGRCLDHPDYERFIELMARLAGWAMDTAVVMYRLMAAGYLERWPDLRIITRKRGPSLGRGRDSKLGEWSPVPPVEGVSE